MHYKVFPNGLMKEAVVIDSDHSQSQAYDNVLGGFLWGASERPEYWHEFLAVINKVKLQGGTEEETISYNDWYVTIHPNRIDIDYAADDQTVATFPIDHVQNAVEGWIRFLQMPEAESSKLIIELSTIDA